MAHVPQRMCVVCRRRGAAEEFIRLTVNRESGMTETDIHRNKQGRGAYICRSAVCIKTAEKKHSLERRFKTTADNELYSQLMAMVMEVTD